jgi:hypothetical protein
MLHTLRFSLQNAVYFIMLTFLVHILFTFYIQVRKNLNVKFKVCKSVHHRTIQINHQPDATMFRFIILTFVYSSICFGRFPVHHQELQPARPRTLHDCHHDTKVKPEGATVIIELLMMGGKTPETCIAVNKRQDNKLKNCCITLVIYLN